MAETPAPLAGTSLVLNAEPNAHLYFFDPSTPLAVTVTNADEWYDVVGATLALQPDAVGWELDAAAGTLTATVDLGEVDVDLSALITSDSSAAATNSVGIRINASASTDTPATGLETTHTVTATYPGTDERLVRVRSKIRNVRTGTVLTISASASAGGDIVSFDQISLNLRRIPPIFGTAV